MSYGILVAYLYLGCIITHSDSILFFMVFRCQQRNRISVSCYIVNRYYFGCIHYNIILYQVWSRTPTNKRGKQYMEHACISCVLSYPKINNFGNLCILASYLGPFEGEERMGLLHTFLTCVGFFMYFPIKLTIN